MPRALLLSVASLCIFNCAAVVAQADDPLAAGFRNPPSTAKPRVWWHWMDGNVSEAGIRADLSWLNRVGVGGVHNFDAALAGPGRESARLVDERVAYLTPRWRELFGLAVTEAQQYGMEFTIAASPGWSESGGPWVKPEQGMKKLVWSETRVQGGRRFAGRLAAPPRTTGTFQNVPVASVPFAVDETLPEHYADVAVVAFPSPAREARGKAGQFEVTSSAGVLESGKLSDGELAQPVLLPYGEGSSAWLQFAYPRPARIQSLTVSVARPAGLALSDMETGAAVWLEASDDGRTFRRVADVPRTGAPQQTIAFAPTTARVFRLVLERANDQPQGIAALLGFPSPPAPTAHSIFECVLHAGPRVHRFEDKAGFTTRAIGAGEDTPSVAPEEAIAQGSIVDLTEKLRPDGTLDWNPPKGEWTVLRLGYSLTGRTNHPASREGTGLEVDKLNARHVSAYFDAYMAEYEKTLGSQLIGKQGLQYMLTDSYEAGIANWTDDLLAQFSERRGYDLRPWLPVLVGHVVASSAASDRFLWDFRQTLSDLLADAHYQQLSTLLRARGMGRYGESHEVGRSFLGDGMQVKKSADVPMGALWTSTLRQPRGAFDADIRESASVAHIYGQNLVAAESLTAFGNTYAFTPETLKPYADHELAMGLNRFVIHTSVHQPDDRLGPGATLGPFGQWFTRHETWAAQAAPWMSYLARSSYLLQQGRFVADIAYLYGEGNNITNLFGTAPPRIPAGYNFDYVNTDALINVLDVKDGKIVTPSGMEYRVLALDPSTQRMSLPVLRKLRDLVERGATIVGERPSTTPSLGDDEQEFATIADRLWPPSFSARSLEETLRSLPVAPDCLLRGTSAGRELRCVHRALADADVYFIASGSAAADSVEASFRVTGKSPELWYADTAEIAPASYRMEAGRTIVPLRLEPSGSVFVVFRKETSELRREVPEPVSKVVATLQGPWDLSFPEGHGAPPRVRFDTLSSWTNHAEPGIKYFSGSATYVTTFSVNRSWLTKRSRVRLDLGSVKNLAEVSVNGKSLGVLWKTPFAIDITDSLRAGGNRLEVKITNLWPNRMIGDKQPGAQRIAYATFDPFKADSPLLPSGLLGPVTLAQVTGF